VSFFARALLLLSLVCAAASAVSSAGEPVRDEGFSFVAAVEDKPEAEGREVVLGRREDLMEIRVKGLRRPPGLSLDPLKRSFAGACLLQDLHHSWENVRCNENFDTSDTEFLNRSLIETRIATGRQADP
jgi:hypothetical protein